MKSSFKVTDPSAQTKAGEAEELAAQLETAQREHQLLTRRLAAAERQAAELQKAQQQLLSSTSWKITAPLRSLRMRMGAPPPVDSNVEFNFEVDDGGHASNVDTGIALLPAGLPDTVVASSLSEELRSNEVCRILDLDWTMKDLVPDAFLEPQLHQPRAEAEALTPMYLGDEPAIERIAFLGSAELAAELAFEAGVIPLTESSWGAQLAASRYAMLLIEPVWHVGNREWRACLSNGARGHENVEALLRDAKARGIPRVLWFRGGKADLDAFAWLALHVDAVYATDEATAAALQERTGRRTDVLPTAIQPALHNPLRSWEQLPLTGFADRVLYDGWLDLLEGASDDPLVRHFKDSRLLVGESEWEFGGVRLADAADYQANAIGCLSPASKIAMSKMVGAEIFRDTPLIPDWRRDLMVQRSIACGAITADTASGGAAWAGQPLRGSPKELGGKIEALLGAPLQLARTRHLAFRELFSNHCLADRLNQVSKDLGLDIHFGRRPAKVACLLITMRPELLAGCLDRFRADRYPHKELVVVLHGQHWSLDDARALIRPGEEISIFQLGKEQSLGSCLNFAAAQSDAEYWAKFDDDDLYGPNYLSDIMLYRRATDFSLGGKTAAFIYSQAEDEILWDSKYASERAWQFRRPGKGERVHIAGGTLIGKREVLEAVPFSDVRRRGSDTDLLRRADEAGFGFVSFDFFNFALFRSGAKGFHTWNSSMDIFKQRTVGVGSASEVESIIYV